MFRTSRYSYNLGPTPEAVPVRGVPAEVVSIDEAMRTTASNGDVVAVQNQVSASTVQLQKSRHERRKDKVFNRRLKKRLEKDGVPARVEVLPDGGIHVHVEKPES